MIIDKPKDLRTICESCIGALCNIAQGVLPSNSKCNYKSFISFSFRLWKWIGINKLEFYIKNYTQHYKQLKPSFVVNVANAALYS